MRTWESSSRKPKSRSKPVRSTGKRAISSGGSIKDYPFLRTFYQHQSVISDGIVRFIFFLVIATLLYAFVIGEAGAIRLLTLKKTHSALEAEVAMLKTSTEELAVEIERAKTDPFVMEKLGRERYGYIYPGDRVYKIVRSPKTK